MPNASISIQVLPKAESDKKILRIIDHAIEVIRKSGVSYEVGPMETTMEGDLDTLITIVRKVEKSCIKTGAKNVLSYIKILYNPEGVMTIKDKVTKFR